MTIRDPGFEGLSPFDQLPVDFWLFVVIAVIMLGVSAALIFDLL